MQRDSNQEPLQKLTMLVVDGLIKCLAKVFKNYASTCVALSQGPIVISAGFEDRT
jgi:hypothetical protein